MIILDNGWWTASAALFMLGAVLMIWAAFAVSRQSWPLQLTGGLVCWIMAIICVLPGMPGI